MKQNTSLKIISIERRQSIMINTIPANNSNTKERKKNYQKKYTNALYAETLTQVSCSVNDLPKNV